MSNEIEAFGAMTTAGLAASTLDRPSVRRRLARVAAARIGMFGAAAPAATTEHATPATCANCDAALLGDFCHACGQSAHVHRSVGHIFEEFAHGIWHFDSKAWRTLPLLVFRPGKLTYDYVHGHRARYIAPLALFLLSVFLMFFVFGLLGGPDLVGAVNGPAGAAAVSDARREVAETTGRLTVAQADPGKAPSIPDLQRELAIRQAALALAENALRRANAATARPGAALAKGKTWQEMVSEQARAGKFTVRSNIPGVDANLRQALLNPDFALYRIEQKAYKLSFLLVPLSLPSMWLLFLWRRNVRTYDHVVFVLYSLSFMSLLFVFIAVLAKFDPTAGTHLSGNDKDFSSGIAGLLLIVPPLHIYAQLKGGYALTTGGALWRAAALSIASVLTLTLFAGLIVSVGLAD